jgi:thiamine-phosphate pyrophosphorylase
MSSKKKLLERSRLYIIVDKKVSGSKSILNIVRKIKDLNPGIIQLRDKESKKEVILKEAYALRKLLLKGKTIFIVNDYIDIAKVVESDGIHLGQSDLPLTIARKLLGKDKIIGVSCHNLNQAIQAQKQGADYISIGPIFPTPIKPEHRDVGLKLIQMVSKMIHIPFFVIGGINQRNLSKVLSSGAKRVAICRGICEVKDVTFTLKKISQILH